MELLDCSFTDPSLSNKLEPRVSEGHYKQQEAATSQVQFPGQSEEKNRTIRNSTPLSNSSGAVFLLGVLHFPMLPGKQHLLQDYSDWWGSRGWGVPARIWDHCQVEWTPGYKLNTLQLQQVGRALSGCVKFKLLDQCPDWCELLYLQKYQLQSMRRSTGLGNTLQSKSEVDNQLFWLHSHAPHFPFIFISFPLH